jgi:hypothetical protein
MAKKKTGSEEKSIVKFKSLFDHLKHIREVQAPNYFDKLSDGDKKSWSNYMICRFLSMQVELIDTINDLQVYQDRLTPEQFYKLCIRIVPKSRRFYPYTKGNGEKYRKELISILSNHFQESEKNVKEYLQLLSKSEVIKIVSMYGYTEKQIDNFLQST